MSIENIIEYKLIMEIIYVMMLWLKSYEIGYIKTTSDTYP